MPFFRYAAVGFLDARVDPDYRATNFPPFGVILYGEEISERLEPPNEPMVLRLEEAKVAFPIVVRRGSYQPHGAKNGTRAGQLACWATTRKGRYKGWLTAGHAAPGLGTIIDAAGDCTDAALIHTDGARPPALTPVRAFRALTAGAKALLEFSPSSVPATVLDVSTDLDICRSPKFPVRFSLSKAGNRGNSGALVSERTTDAPLGMYLGAFVPATAQPGQPPSGFALAMYQLEEMLDLEAYR